MSDLALIGDLAEAAPPGRERMAAGRVLEAVAPGERVSLRDWVALMGAMLGAFMAVLDIQITNASLNDILGSLGATLEERAPAGRQ